jgi:aldose 1-epimerase
MEQAAYSVGIKTVDGFQIYVLQESQKAVAEIAPGLGTNCYAFRAADAGPGSEGGNWLNLIDVPPDLATLQEHPDIFGIPILFPFPNRIRGGAWQFEGKTYQFNKPPESPTSIHGLLLNQPYQVEKRSAGRDGAILGCSLDTRDFPDVGRQYPFPFKIQITYTLGPVSPASDTPDQRPEVPTLCLKMDVSITNTGERNMPMGFGIHPYFHTLLAPNSDATQAMITVPAAKYWELDEALVPTGTTYSASGALDLRNGQPFAKTELDHVFTDVQLTDGISRCIIDNRDTGRGMILESDAQFRELVVYAPPGRSSICFEPYTCPTDAINLEAKGIPAGVIVLSPDETFSATVRIIPI